ncbi:MAG: type IX secretion/gliding motility protein PorT/SprT [Bacteroidia bacterium]
MKKLFIISWFLVLVSALCYAQPTTEKGLNLPGFYHRRLHFGFSIGYNLTDFRVHTIANSKLYHNLRDTVRYPYDTLNLKSIKSRAEPGFNLGIICDFKIQNYVRLRFLPGISFASRSLLYYFTGATAYSQNLSFTAIRQTQSAFILLPLNIKLQSKRIRNFGVYVIGGACYSIDLASGKHDQASSDAVRLRENDFLYQGGGGVDFYFPYFKFAIEFKISQGMRNILIKDGTEFTTPINSLNSHVFLFSISFEG